VLGPWLSGEKVNLRPLRDGDTIRRVEWLNDRETVRLFTGSEPIRAYERVDGERWLQTLEADLTAFVWAVETREHRHIGDVDLHNMDRQSGLAKLTILIGDKAFWNCGYGTDAVKTLLRYAFSELALESVGLRVYGFNKRAIRCYEKCGFIQVGAASRDDRTASGPAEIWMTITKDRFFVENPDASAIHT